MGEAKSIQFDNIYYGLTSEPGVLKLAPIGLGWKTPIAETILTVSAEDFKRMQWIHVARNYQLRIQLKNGDALKFDGFLKDDFDTLRELIKSNYRLNLEIKELSVKGWNWGKTDFQGSQLLFNVGSKTAFELPLNQVANTNLASRNEVSLEFMQPEQMDEDAHRGASKKAQVHELVEMRFYIPGTVTVTGGDGDEGEGDEEKSKKKIKGKEKIKENGGTSEKTDGEEQEEEEEEETTEEISAASMFHEMVKEKADLGQVSGEGIILFSDILLLTPRGRYDIDMFPTFLRLRGKTYDYKIQYTSVIKLFLLPKLDDIGLDPPLRQGQTRYPFLVLQFVKDTKVDMELNIDKETIEKNYNNKLEEKYEDKPLFEVVSSVFKGLTQRKVTVPGSYRSHHGNSAFKCSMKANEGYLYPLEKCFLFIPKPPTFIPIQDIISVTFSRVSSSASSSRTFDLKFNLKNKTEIQFSSINREEHKNIEDWMKTKNINAQNDMTEDSMFAYKAIEELGDTDEDEEEEVMPRSRRRGDPQSMDIDNEEDEDESVDEDFVAEESESDVAEEYDENYQGSGSSSSSEQEDNEPPKKKTKTKK
ncbi:9224_t:CDS:10 [Ambispora leptoticha]|uniref:FACT complex subunit POB3 n=1 Tax=Ambispora leptoticha TaxID=144679 RepID=A0A9N8WKF5_9GLOM|nr:9224_t:CDS:10 [Ambispora leptoticha]